MIDLGQRIRAARRDAKLTQRKLAETLGIRPVSVTQWELGITKPQLDRVEAIANALHVSQDWLLNGGNKKPVHMPQTLDVTGLDVLGVVHAGSFVDITIGQERVSPEKILVARDPRFMHAKQYALRVAGDSMNRRFPNGSYVTCVDWPDTGLELKIGQCLHVERVKAASLIETTVKIYAVRNGKQWLDPDSTNPNHKPIEITGDEDTEITIKGLVTGFWMPMNI
jgi:SOS-response transcriptional repressor LexA